MEPGAIEAFFAPVLPVRTRRMFGGIGIYAGDRMFALYVAGRLYLKTSDDTRSSFVAAGSEPFRFMTQGGLRETSYWSLPPAGSRDGALAEWVALARRAVEERPAADLRRRGSSSRRLPR